MAARKKAEPPPSDLIQKGLPCEDCGSSDALALYSDDHTHCFSCGKTRGPQSGAEGDAEGRRSAHGEAGLEDVPESFPRGQIKGIRARGLTQETCREWDYQVRQNAKGELEHLAVYRDPKGKVVGVKIRNVGTDGERKDFSWAGNAKGNLYGRHKWSSGGRILTICEGEIDTLTVSQCYAHKYPVVGVPNGAHEAAKAIAKNLDFINTFPKVILAFDMDEQGREACIECAQLLPAGKAFIANWGSYKDPNEMLQAGKAEEITRALWNAEAYRPDGIVDARSLTAEALNPRPMGRPWPWKFMTEWTYGRRYGELYTFGAGSGIGKSDGFAEIIAASLQGTTVDGNAPNYTPEAWGCFAFEGGGPVQLKLRIAGKIGNRRFHLPIADPDNPEWTREELEAALDRMDRPLWEAGGKLFINDHRGTSDWASIKERMRYLRHAENVRNFLVDPLSAMVAGEEDERKVLDAIVLEYALLMGELETTGYLASHLTRPKDGPTHEEGGQVRLGQFRGSNGIGMYSDFVFGWERNTQAMDGTETNTVARCVKDRLSGNFNGRTARLGYDQINGRLEQATTQFIGDV